MDVAGNDPEGSLPRPVRSSTIIIRWWHEAADGMDRAHNSHLRGTVLDLGGRTLGQFAGKQALFDLVGAITDEPQPTVGRAPRSGAGKA